MKTVFKYPLQHQWPATVVNSFEDFTPLKIAFQNGQLQLWALVDTDSAAKEYRVRVVRTGHPLEIVVGYVPLDGPRLQYIDTVLDGSFVWHFFLEQ